jgi:hypothetical protein
MKIDGMQYRQVNMTIPVCGETYGAAMYDDRMPEPAIDFLRIEFTDLWEFDKYVQSLNDLHRQLHDKLEGRTGIKLYKKGRE